MFYSWALGPHMQPSVWRCFPVNLSQYPMAIPLLLLLSGYLHKQIHLKLPFELTVCMEHDFFGLHAISYYDWMKL